MLGLTSQFCLAVIFTSPHAEWLLGPSIEATGVNAEHLAHGANGELELIRLDEHVLHSLPGRRCSHRQEGCIFGEIRVRQGSPLFSMSRSSVTRANSSFNRLISDHLRLRSQQVNAYHLIQAYYEWVLTPRRCKTFETACPRSVICLTASALKSSVNRGCPMIVSLPRFVRGKVSTNLGAIQGVATAMQQLLRRKSICMTI